MIIVRIRAIALEHTGLDLNIAKFQSHVLLKKSIRPESLTLSCNPAAISEHYEKTMETVVSFKNYFEYYHQDQTHLGLEKNTPVVRAFQSKPKGAKLIALPRDGGLHHRYIWKKAA